MPRVEPSRGVQERPSSLESPQIRHVACLPSLQELPAGPTRRLLLQEAPKPEGTTVGLYAPRGGHALPKKEHEAYLEDTPESRAYWLKKSDFFYAPAWACDDEAIVGNAVSHWGPTLEKASPRLRDDPDIVLAAVTSRLGGGDALEFASARLRDDEDIVRACRHFRSASDRLKNNPEFLIEVMQSPGDGLIENYAYLPAQIRNRPDVAAAMTENGRRDPKRTLTPEEFRLLPRALHEDVPFLLKLLGYNHKFSSSEDLGPHLNEDLKNDPGFARQLCVHAPGETKHLSESLRRRKDIARLMVSSQAALLEHLPHFQDDRDVVLDALDAHAQAYQWASERLQHDPGVLRASRVVVQTHSIGGLAAGEGVYFDKKIRGDRIPWEWDQEDDIVAAIVSAAEYVPDYRVNLIGHSWGAQTAMAVTNRLRAHGIRVHRLVTLDPVAWFPEKPNNHDVWVNVHQQLNFWDGLASLPFLGSLLVGIFQGLFVLFGAARYSDWVATMGRQLGHQDGADLNVATDEPHEDEWDYLRAGLEADPRLLTHRVRDFADAAPGAQVNASIKAE